jgi:hypothetical protein
MDSVKFLDLYVCGNASVQKDIKEHSVAACSHVMCVAWRYIKGHKADFSCSCDVFLAKYTHHNDMDAHWNGAKSTTRKKTEERNGYKKYIFPDIR